MYHPPQNCGGDSMSERHRALGRGWHSGNVLSVLATVIVMTLLTRVCSVPFGCFSDLDGPSVHETRASSSVQLDAVFTTYTVNDLTAGKDVPPTSLPDPSAGPPQPPTVKDPAQAPPAQSLSTRTCVPGGLWDPRLTCPPWSHPRASSPLFTGTKTHF